MSLKTYMWHVARLSAINDCARYAFVAKRQSAAYAEEQVPIGSLLAR